MISMHYSAPNQPYQTWLIIFSFLIPFSLSDPRITESGLYCGNSTRSTQSGLIPTFVKEMETLSQLITTSHFATYHLNSAFPMFVLAQCHQDLSQTDCLLCYAASRTKLPRCLPAFSARIYLDGCFLRYDNYSFYQESLSASMDTVQCSTANVSSSGHDENDKFGFVKSVGYVVANVTNKAVKNGGFGVAEVNGIYALGQCWESLGKEGCRECLEKAGKAARGCVPKREGRGMNAGCYLRYSTEKFYNHEGDTGHGHGKFITEVFGLFFKDL